MNHGYKRYSLLHKIWLQYIHFLKVPSNYLSIPGFLNGFLMEQGIKSQLLVMACKFSVSGSCLHLQPNLLSESVYSLLVCFFPATPTFFSVPLICQACSGHSDLCSGAFSMHKAVHLKLDKMALLIISVGITDS